MFTIWIVKCFIDWHRNMKWSDAPFKGRAIIDQMISNVCTTVKSHQFYFGAEKKQGSKSGFLHPKHWAASFQSDKSIR